MVPDGRGPDEAAERIAAFIRSLPGDEVRLCLSGGSTPTGVYRRLSDRSDIDWARLRFFWGDERAVSPASDESNYGLARETLLEPVGAAPERVHRILAEKGAEAAASLYDRTLRAHVGTRSGPLFDLVLLGIGTDGHTASLFPGRESEWDGERLAFATDGGEGRGLRVSLTPAALSDAREVWVLAFGAEKSDIVREALDAGRGRALPTDRIGPRSGGVLWLLDASSASELDRGGSPHDETPA